jgi:hypothetical protein
VGAVVAHLPDTASFVPNVDARCMVGTDALLHCVGRYASAVFFPHSMPVTVEPMNDTEVKHSGGTSDARMTSCDESPKATTVPLLNKPTATVAPTATCENTSAGDGTVRTIRLLSPPAHYMAPLRCTPQSESPNTFTATCW